MSGGSSSCTGQTSKCGSNQTQTSSCKDCSGTMHYTCVDKEDPCASVTCPTAVSCGSEGCKTTSTKTDCCASVCTACNPKTCTVRTCTHSSKPSGSNWVCNSCTGQKSDCSTYSGWNCYQSCTSNMGCDKYGYSCRFTSNCDTNYRYTCTNTYSNCYTETKSVCCPHAM